MALGISTRQRDPVYYFQMWMNFLFVVMCVTSSGARTLNTEEQIQELRDRVEALALHLMFHEFEHEEAVRNEEHSGLKSIHTSNFATIHDTSNRIRTVGMAEFIGVLHGVRFQHHREDYKLRKPSDKGYNATLEDIQFPDVPPEVTSQPNLTAQIEELRQWFKAWRDSDHSIRDYRPYFKPVLCYLEGYWATADRDSLYQEYLEFQKARFSAYTDRATGEESSLRPATIVDFKNGMPIYALWDHRILCHNLSQDVPLSAFRAVKGANPINDSDPGLERFQLNPSQPGLMDKLMSEIPGRDGYGVRLTYDPLGRRPTYTSDSENVIIDPCYYHRWFRDPVSHEGRRSRHRAFSDDSVFMALTTDPKVASISVPIVGRNDIPNGGARLKQSWTYALPIEIIYMTPLQSWNPYNLTYHGCADTVDGKVVTANGRNGSLNKDMAFNGTNSDNFYLTPVEFYSDGQTSTDNARAVGVLDESGAVRDVAASGFMIKQYIPSVGKVRLRYPIGPILTEST